MAKNVEHIVHKRSNVNNKKPTAEQLEYGEIAVNYYKDNEKLFIKNSNNEIVDITQPVRNLITEAQTDLETLNNNIIDNELVVSSALNDLEERKADKYTVYTKEEVNSRLSNKQDRLVSGTNIKTINSQSLLGSGNITIEGGSSVQSDWNQDDTTAGDYIKNKPTIPDAQVQSDWNATSGIAQILNKPTDTQLQADWTQTNKYNKSYIKHKPYFSGYYIAVDTLISSREYVGVEEPSDKPDSTYRYLYYYNGSSWRLIDQYIEPDQNLYYIVSTDLGYYNSGTSEHYYPAGYVAFVNSSGRTVHAPYNRDYYIVRPLSTVDPSQGSDVYKYQRVMEGVKGSAYNGSYGTPKLDGYNYIFSFTENDKDSIDSTVTKFVKLPTLQTAKEFVSNVTDTLSNTTKHIQGWFVYKNTGTTSTSVNDWTLIEVNNGSTTGRSNDPNYPIDFYGAKENWDNQIWVQRFLGAQLYPFIKANESHNYDYGWSDFQESTFYINGDGGWISGRVGGPIMDSSGRTVNINILNLSGQISSALHNINYVVRFNFKDVEIGQKSIYAEMGGYNDSHRPTAKSLEGRLDMYDVKFNTNQYKYTIETLGNNNSNTLSVVKLTETEYNALTTKDNNTLYVIV